MKKEVKQLMEEAVTRKFVHEQSSSVTSLCAAVEACLSQGLRRRALGLFKTSSTTALLHKVAKHCPEANYISKKVLDIENTDPSKRSSSSSDSTSKPPILKKNSNTSITNSASPPPPTIRWIGLRCLFCVHLSHSVLDLVFRYLWIRLALYEKKLANIINHLVTNATRYYERDSLVADPDFGSILSSLLVGPCALDYTRSKYFHFEAMESRKSSILSSTIRPPTFSSKDCWKFLDRSTSRWANSTASHQLGQSDATVMSTTNYEFQTQSAQLRRRQHELIQIGLDGKCGQGLCGIIASKFTCHIAVWQKQCARFAGV